ncbi:MAG: phosphoglycerate mutase family protein [Actinomycetota bacterium]
MREPPVYLVRHAKAGDRRAWTEDDRLRPLSKKGRRQAEALVGAFSGLGVGRVLSSPYVRCEQTVRPLALDRGLSLDLTEALAEGAPLEGLLEIIADLDDVALVACGHGDLLPAMIDHLRRRGVPTDDGATKKGSTWLLERERGAIVRARYLPPPAV